MASEDYIPLSGEGEQYEVIDEVTNTEFKGMDDATKKGEIILQGSEVYGTSETHREIRSSLEKEGLSAHDIYEESSKQAQSMSEEASTVHTKDADITKAPPPEQVVGVENSSEVNRSVSKLSDKLKITGSVNAEKMDTVYIKFVQSVTQTVPEESKMLDEKTINIEANQNNESENKMEVIKPKSSKDILLAPCADVQHKKAIVSNLNVLLVGGLYPGQSGVSEIIRKTCENYMSSPTTMVALSLVNSPSVSASLSFPLNTPVYDNHLEENKTVTQPKFINSIVRLFEKCANIIHKKPEWLTEVSSVLELHGMVWVLMLG